MPPWPLDAQHAADEAAAAALPAPQGLRGRWGSRWGGFRGQRVLYGSLLARTLKKHVCKNARPGPDRATVRVL